MIEKIKANLEKYHMIENGDTVIVGVSGGADSVCLLMVLKELQQEMDITLRVVHIEHGVRGADSESDAKFVMTLCERLNVPCTEVAFDVPKLAREQGQSVEEMGRILRYQVFEAEAAKEKSGKIAVAHNQNDNAETMLHHFARGSGLQGLAGIPPVRGVIIRPLLVVERAEIERYLAEAGQEYCTDATNFEPLYTRNRIRGEVIPVLQEVNAGAIAHMGQAAEVLRKTVEYMDTQVAELEELAVTYRGKGALLDAKKMQNVPEILQSMLIHLVLERCSGSSKDIGEIHINMILALFAKQVGRQVMLPYELVANRVYEGICIQTEENEKKAPASTALAGNPDYTCRIIDCTGEEKEFPKKKYTKWLDYDKIEDSLCVRNRQPGDYFWLEEQGHSKRLKQYFVDNKIPQEMREQIPLIADGAHIAWIVGYRLSAYYKVTKHTRKILEIRYNGGKEDE